MIFVLCGDRNEEVRGAELHHGDGRGSVQQYVAGTGRHPRSCVLIVQQQIGAAPCWAFSVQTGGAAVGQGGQGLPYSRSDPPQTYPIHLAT